MVDLPMDSQYCFHSNVRWNSSRIYVSIYIEGKRPLYTNIDSCVKIILFFYLQSGKNFTLSIAALIRSGTILLQFKSVSATVSEKWYNDTKLQFIYTTPSQLFTLRQKTCPRAFLLSFWSVFKWRHAALLVSLESWILFLYKHFFFLL